MTFELPSRMEYIFPMVSFDAAVVVVFVKLFTGGLISIYIIENREANQLNLQ